MHAVGAGCSRGVKGDCYGVDEKAKAQHHSRFAVAVARAAYRRKSVQAAKSFGSTRDDTPEFGLIPSVEQRSYCSSRRLPRSEIFRPE